jgi:site-specific DNA-methyltransferase (adenine-specific)
MKERTGTSTSNFGVSRRESHDATAFYSRFGLPEISDDDTIVVAPPFDQPCILGDARAMDEVPNGSVALVVTSPPYFAGKTYEEELGKGHIPASYAEHLALLRDVFAECKRKLEPGGRIAVNVANLGRKPYRSQAADVIAILQDDLKMLLRGEVVWIKGDGGREYGASGSCAWGSFKSAANPVLRDVSERLIIASKGRFDRAKTVQQRRREGLPSENEITNDEFMEATIDVWNIAPESARRVKHPAPFPVGLPERVIDLYTYKDDLVLDPFMGSGTTLIAALRKQRQFVGYDTSPEFVEIARERVAAAVAHLAEERGDETTRPRPAPVTLEAPELPFEDYQARASKEGKAHQDIAQAVLERAGFTVTERNLRLSRLGLTVNFVANDAEGAPWYFDVSGAFTSTRAGLLRTDTVFKSLGRANVLQANGIRPVVFLTSNLPKRRSEGDKVLRAAGPASFFDAIEMLSDEGLERLAVYAGGGHTDVPLEGFWTSDELKGCL